MALERVKQTSRTLLIEEFNPQVEGLDTLVLVNDVYRKNNFLENIRESLEVNNFEDFVKKFAPTVYEYTVSDEGSELQMSFRYSLDKKEGARECEISKHAFYKMVMEIYEDRAESGLSNTKTDTFTKIAELLSPQAALKQAKKYRKQLEYSAEQLKKARPGIEEKNCIRKIKEVRKNIINTYSKSAVNLIPLALADTQEKLNVMALPDKKNDHADQQLIEGSKCKYHFDNDGELVVEKMPALDSVTGEEIDVIDPEQGTTALIDIPNRIKRDFEQHAPEQMQSEIFENMIVELYTGHSPEETRNGEIVEADIKKLKKKKDLFTKLYKNAQEQFINTISDTVEKMLDVKVFFDHATSRGRNLAAPLIVSNCTASELLKSDVKDDFKYYISEMGKETAENAIWFAIIPAIGDSDFVDVMDTDDEDIDYDDDIIDDELEMEDDINTYTGKKLVSMDSCKALIEILKNGKITTFFNYKANDKTGFDNLTGEIVEKYKNKLESLNGNKYAVFTYPNFTLIPMKETCIEIGSVNKNNEETMERLNLPGVYVESSYVAAGLVVGSQDPYVLKDKGFKVDINNACVRFDFEEGDNKKIMMTRMAREGDAMWDSRAEELIREDQFGFCFCGNQMFYKNNPVKNSYVYTARTMAKDEKSGKYKSLYKTLTEKYIILYLSVTNGGSSAKESEVKKFITGTVKNWTHACADDEKKDVVNNILRNGEEVCYLEADKKIHIKFNEDDELVDFEIEEDN